MRFWIFSCAFSRRAWHVRAGRFAIIAVSSELPALFSEREGGIRWFHLGSWRWRFTPFIGINRPV